MCLWVLYLYESFNVKLYPLAKKGLGTLYANTVVAITMLGPQWWLQTIKQVSLIVD